MNLEKLGIPPSMVTDLMLRRLLIDGMGSLQGMSNALKLSIPVVETVFRQMRAQQLVEVKGMSGNDYNFMLTNAGRAMAAERYQMARYFGAAPVSLADYRHATKMQAAQPVINRRILADALSDLVVSDRMLDQLGPAVISQISMFIYGPTGNGKTSIAERILRVYQDTVFIPYAVEVDGQIIILYDPVVHQKVEMDLDDVDPRWVRCRRPCVITGGELVAEMLELRLDKSSGLYASPLQMKSNNGILVVDDFGRQLMSPRDLLNRWIVPLDRRVDYLTLGYGVKFQIPFELMVVFATNLEPSDLADEAFFRRIQNKILVDAVDEESFDEIFRRVTAARTIPCEPDSAEFFRRLCYLNGPGQLRACYPGDICNILVSISKYENRPVEMSKSDLERAVGLYFAHK
jgi:hypothetical protein